MKLQIVVGLLCTAGLIAVAPLTAQADTTVDAVPAANTAYNVSGTLNQDDSDTYFDTYRKHTSGPTFLDLTKNVYGSDGGSCESVFALYKGTGSNKVLVTNNLVFNGGSSPSGGTDVEKEWKTASGSSTTIPAGTYALYGHTICAGGGLYHRAFTGVLDM